MYIAVQFGKLVNEDKSWLQGYFDPVDFVITDPLGRRVGYTASLGELKEIPQVFYSGNGTFEQFLIPNAVPGMYKIELFGLNAEVIGAIKTATTSQEVKDILGEGEKRVINIKVDITQGGPGDLDSDGDIDENDKKCPVRKDE